MLFHFQLSVLARQLTATFKGPGQPIQKASRPDDEDFARAQREIARLEAVYALPAFGVRQHPLVRLVSVHPGRFFGILTVIFLAKALGF